MFRTGFVLGCLVFLACNNKKAESDDEKGFSYDRFSEAFRLITPPVQISDTGLMKNKDTTTIRYPEFAAFIGDSLKNKLFGKASKPKYVGMFRMDAGQGYTYYMVKALSGAKRAALLLIFNKDQFEAVFPFLIPDNNPNTSQLSSIDKSFSIQKGVTLKKPGNQISEGRDVFVYDPASKQFSLILTNPLDNVQEVVINPIDTLPRKHRFAGDYTKDKKNFISIRDGRYPNQLMVFIHLDKNEGECTGELKGDILLTSTTAAIYRQGGDACVLSFRFSSSSVTIKEEEGCGGHRGLNCTFDGTYPRKKEAKPKATTKKKTAK